MLGMNFAFVVTYVPPLGEKLFQLRIPLLTSSMPNGPVVDSLKDEASITASYLDWCSVDMSASSV